MNEMSEGKQDDVLTHVEPVFGIGRSRDCPIAKIQETASLLSGEIDSIGTPSPSRGPSRVEHGSITKIHTPSHFSEKQNSRFKFDAEEISIWSDTLSVGAMNPPLPDTHLDEKRSLLSAKDVASPRPSISSTASRSRPGSRTSRQSRKSRSHRSSQNEPVTRGDLLMELARQGSTRSRDCAKSVRDSLREKNAKKKRKNSGSTTSSSSTTSVDDINGSKGFPGRGKRGNMTAKEAVQSEVLCGCLQKAKFLYFVKPFVFLIFGVIFLAGGLAFTVLHFMYEDSLTQKNPPYFTYGTITFSTGLILFMVGLVWVPIKKQKWDSGMASPMLAALEKWHMEQSELELKPLGFLVSAVPALATVQAGALTAVVDEKKEKKCLDSDKADDKV